MKRWLVITAAKIVSFLSRIVKIGAGGTWPGEIALTYDPSLLSSISEQLTGGIILIAGTNGKTTTTKMVSAILANSKFQIPNDKIVHNATGANLLNGITSALIQKTDFLGRLRADIGIFEVDEATLPLILKHSKPRIVVLLNLFRDQLDRYGEVDILAEKWLKALSKLPQSTTVAINADDPHLAFIGKHLKAEVKYFGLGNRSHYMKKMSHAVDSIYCPNCGHKLGFSGFYLSHLGQWKCLSCNFTHPKNDIQASDVSSPLEGIYSIYNTMAAILVAEELGFGHREEIKKLLVGFKPAFGRQEEIMVDGKKIALYLAKNPVGFDVSLKTVLTFSPHVLILALNDRIPDGRDVSWIWDVDFEMIPDQVTVIASGDRAYDMGLRIKYSGTRYEVLDTKNYKRLRIFEDLKEAIDNGLAKIKKGEKLYILPTYTAMLEVRKILMGRKIL